MKIKLKKWNKTTFFLLVTILALQNFAQLIPTSTYMIPGFLKFSDIGVLLAMFWTAWVYFLTKPITKTTYTYGFNILALFFLVIISSFMAFNFFDQPIMYGIRAQRIQLACFLLYFPITRALQSGVLKREDLLKIVFWVGTFELIIYILQYFLVDVASFTYVNLDEVRFDTARLRFPYLLPLIMGMFCLNNILNMREKQVGYLVKNLFYVIISAFLILVICQHRAPSLILVLTWIVAYLLWKKNISIKLLSGFIGLLVGISVISNLSIVQSALDVLLNGIGENTLLIREAGQLYYLSRLQESPMFGFGYPNLNSTGAITASGRYLNFFLVDNGLIGFAYIFGICGVIWLAFLFFKSYKLSYYLYKKKRVYTYLLYFVFETGNLYIGLHWYYLYTFPFVFVISLLSYDYLVARREEYEE